MRPFFHHRRGFTLIELIVTMGIIIVLLSIAVVISNSATMDSYKLVGAGDRLSQAFITAKSRAARDKAPRGVRMLVGNDGYLRELIYIEQPEPWLPDQTFTHPVNSTNAVPSQLVLQYPQSGGSPTFPKPQPGTCLVYLLLSATDSARFNSTFVSGQTHVVSSPDVSAAFAFTTATIVASNTLAYAPAGTVTWRLGVTNIINPDLAAGQTPTLPPATPAIAKQGTFQTTQFGVYLPAKPLAGEPTLILSRNVAVDLSASLPAMTSQNVDILFAPAGHVMYRSEGVIAFLLRDTFKYTPLPSSNPTVYTWLDDVTTGTGVGVQNFQKAGEMVLVSVYPKTGTVTTKPVAEPGGNPNDPFKFAKDSINTGL